MKHNLITAGVVLLMLAASVGCGKKEAPAQKHVVLQLKWTFNAGFVGDLVAKEKGFWKDEGLDVDVRAGGIGITPIKVVAAGDAQFGVATGDQLLLALEEKAPTVAIGVVYQENPLAWIVRGINITHAADLKGKKVALTFIDDEPLFDAMTAKARLDPKKDLQVVPVKFDTSPFMRNEVDAFPVYRNTQAIELAEELRKQGVTTSLIGPSDEGIVSYSNLYFTASDYEKSNRDVVRAFMAGVIKGWQYAREHPDEAAAIVAKFDKETKPEIIRLQVLATNKLVSPSANTHIGGMTKEGWMSTQQILIQAKQMKQQVDVSKVYTTAYVH